jgi:hypothetical protein
VPRTRSLRRYRDRRTTYVLGATLVAAALAALLLPLSGAALPQAAPVNTSPPTISGTAASGQTLAASTGSWTGTAPISFSYAWRRCDASGASCAPITGATDATYVVQNADVGARLRVSVTATNDEGTASALSDATAVVASAGAPRYSGEPRISGSPVVGQRLATTNGVWTGSLPISYTYQWFRCGSNGGNPDASNCAVIAGATANSYVLASTDTGHRMRVRVTARNALGVETATSNATGAVTASAPVNSRIPTVTGTWVEGQTVTVSRGTWSGAAPLTYTYQWVRCNTAGGACVAIAGATGTQYRLVQADVGHKIRVNVTARNAGGSRTVMSGESATVAAAGPAGVITLPPGERSIPVTSVPTSARLVVDRVVFTPTVVRSRVTAISVQVRVKDTRGYVVRDALVFLRSTPLVTRAGQPRRPTQSNGYAVFQMSPRANFPTARRGAVQFFVKAYRQGDNPLAGVAGYRLVQIRIAR